LAHPYNLYFTPDGTRAIVVAERLQRLDFYDPHTWKPLGSLQVPWRGVDLDFSADGSFLLASTEWTGMVVRIDVATIAMTGSLAVGGLPIDVRLAPDGSVFYVANQGRHGVSVIDPVNMREVQFIPTGRGAHGLEISRDTRSIYVSNRLAGTGIGDRPAQSRGHCNMGHWRQPRHDGAVTGRQSALDLGPLRSLCLRDRHDHGGGPSSDRGRRSAARFDLLPQSWPL